MRRIVCCLLVLLLCSQMTLAFAKREVILSDYDSVGDFYADIEVGTKVIFDAYLFSTDPYVDEDSYSLAYPLLPWNGIQYSPTIGIYAREEDLGDIHATSIGAKKETHYVHIEGVAEDAPKNGYLFVYIMDGKGSIEIIDPPTTTYCLDEESDVEAFKQKAINCLDKVEIKEGIVVKTDDTNTQLNHYQVWVSCGNYTVYFQTQEKQFYVDDCVNGVATYSSFRKDGVMRITNADISLRK